jgi:hypothetical protein
MEEPQAPLQVQPGYALGQLARALTAEQSHSDPAEKERASKKIEAWRQVFAGMLAGTLNVGSRTPLSGAPAWATLEVLTGGFASGTLLAGGPLRPHEVARLMQLGHGEETNAPAARALLNASYLDESGLGELGALLRSGCYRIEVPEEGALLTVAWLLEHDLGDEARALLSELAPYFNQLRFYPLPAEQPLGSSSLVHVQSVHETIRKLSLLKDADSALRQRAVLTVWNPLLDRLVTLFAETVSGPLPTLAAVGEGGAAMRIEGGWPCEVHPAWWNSRARAWLADYARLRQLHPPCRRLERPGETGTRLRTYLERAQNNLHALSRGEVRDIRRILAQIEAKRGLPGSSRARALRAHQAWLARLPTRQEHAALLRERLQKYSPHEGLPALEPVLAPISEKEAEQHGYLAGRPLRASLRRRLLMCLDAPVEVLVAQGAIASGEILARVTPQLSAQVWAAGLADADLRRLYGAVYQAFRRRRSLLLLNLQSQVRYTELPWVAAGARLRVDDDSTRATARRTLTELVRLALTAFPHAILPNKLLQEVQALCERAGLMVPIVEEIAADIFMGELTAKYLYAAQWAAQLLGGSLYERYYGIPYARVRAMEPTLPESGGSQAWQSGLAADKSSAAKSGPPLATAFMALCRELAGEPAGGHHSVARNGRILEQVQIITTHNLAPLTQALELREELALVLPDLARSCYTFVCHEQQRHSLDHRHRLHMLKNTAYAWRQMVFFVSLLPPAQVQEFLHWAHDHLTHQPQKFRERFSHTLAGLERAVAGSSPGADLFLGWVGPRRAK